jgi:hypothetical protein
MVVNANAVKPCRFASGNESSNVRQRPPNRNSERNTKPIHQ